MMLPWDLLPHRFMTALRMVVVMVLTLLMHPAAGSAAPSVVLCNDEHFPLSYRDDAGQPAGMYPEILREAARRSGVQLDVRVVPWTRALRALEMGEAALGGVFSTTRARGQWRVSLPLHLERIVAVLPQDATFHATRVAELKPYRTCIVEGWNYGPPLDGALVDGGWNLDPAPSEALCLRKLEAGRVQVALVGEAGALRLPDPAVPTRTRTVRVGLELPVHVFWPLTVPDETVRRVDGALRHMDEDGTLRRIVQRYLEP
ncbi:substrate-binding periplasmic protein [Nitratidesulfovibrio termitidis]|uniref:substrate-binding periplasmic protein n=1 Tax=Nitratidesulfovibrio termitidis TaxID=42252 RepID=UPI0003FD0117|nr:transporter substrate-binding domain-containing protein [Nitratidesulfovibrio termitidis]